MPLICCKDKNALGDVGQGCCLWISGLKAQYLNQHSHSFFCLLTPRLEEVKPMSHLRVCPIRGLKPPSGSRVNCSDLHVQRKTGRCDACLTSSAEI